jgi:hypothetical protein
MPLEADARERGPGVSSGAGVGVACNTPLLGPTTTRGGGVNRVVDNRVVVIRAVRRVGHAVRGGPPRTAAGALLRCLLRRGLQHTAVSADNNTGRRPPIRLQSPPISGRNTLRTVTVSARHAMVRVVTYSRRGEGAARRSRHGARPSGDPRLNGGIELRGCGRDRRGRARVSLLERVLDPGVEGVAHPPAIHRQAAVERVQQLRIHVWCACQPTTHNGRGSRGCYPGRYPHQNRIAQTGAGDLVAAPGGDPRSGATPPQKGSWLP